ncbi:MAG: type II toxin-antitoxin system HicA family toxin, partial [Desulfobacteraceae bacterium]|nr:type II toxin-antitoxin system HicA family toxin [Desulfobacteraceae bacterium]
MGRLRVLSGKQVCEILSRHGFAQIRQSGSHVVMQKKLPDTTIT